MKLEEKDLNRLQEYFKNPIDINCYKIGVGIALNKGLNYEDLATLFIDNEWWASDRGYNSELIEQNKKQIVDALAEKFEELIKQ